MASPFHKLTAIDYLQFHKNHIQNHHPSSSIAHDTQLQILCSDRSCPDLRCLCPATPVLCPQCTQQLRRALCSAVAATVPIAAATLGVAYTTSPGHHRIILRYPHTTARSAMKKPNRNCQSTKPRRQLLTPTRAALLLVVDHHRHCSRFSRRPPRARLSSISAPPLTKPAPPPLYLRVASQSSRFCHRRYHAASQAAPPLPSLNPSTIAMKSSHGVVISSDHLAEWTRAQPWP
ncbi:hypothetical protein M0R45_000460 [Rubus argutus]|uniref:Uncharacterized protein n=1 Tax=Rubus argutus TaxID=59490 RepID=A0AAW1VLC3_RUBAR